MTGPGNPLVTIGIPTYNRGDNYLRQALESALAQSYGNIEIVVSNNGSTDDTKAVVQSYDDSRIRYYEQVPPLIPNDNFNFCLAQARGDYFLLLHDDDKIDADFVESCLRAGAYRTDHGAIISGVRIIGTKGNTILEVANKATSTDTGEFFLEWFEGRLSLYVCSTLYNTRLLKELGGFHSRHNLFQDVAATARIIAKSGRVDVLDVKASARQHQGKWTHVGRIRDWCEDSLELLDLLCELSPSKAQELRARGEPFFARINYRRATDIGPLSKRLRAYTLVYTFFGRRYLPPARMVFESTSAYSVLRSLKQALLGAAPRNA
jgi:glycosyltransferase involved in cell wall biosynthesis